MKLSLPRIVPPNGENSNCVNSSNSSSSSSGSPGMCSITFDLHSHFSAVVSVSRILEWQFPKNRPLVNKQKKINLSPTVRCAGNGSKQLRGRGGINRCCQPPQFPYVPLRAEWKTSLLMESSRIATGNAEAVSERWNAADCVLHSSQWWYCWGGCGGHCGSATTLGWLHISMVSSVHAGTHSRAVQPVKRECVTFLYHPLHWWNEKVVPPHPIA